jgi:hypothetical protein
LSAHFQRMNVTLAEQHRSFPIAGNHPADRYQSQQHMCICWSCTQLLVQHSTQRSTQLHVSITSVQGLTS